MRGSLDRVMECTSPTFDGIVAHMKAPKSWVSKWQRLERFLPGLYAVKTFGRLPEDVEADLEAKGIPYEPTM